MLDLVAEKRKCVWQVLLGSILAASVCIAQIPQIDCGWVNPETDCTTNVTDSCSCVGTFCSDNTRRTYSRPLTYESNFGVCAYVIKSRNGPCWWRDACKNSGGTDEGPCIQPHQPTCERDTNVAVQSGSQQHYYYEDGWCSPNPPPSCTE